MAMKFNPATHPFLAQCPPSIPSPGNNAWLGDVLHSDAPDDKKLSAGFYKQGPGEALVYTYTYDEMKICYEVKGKFTVTDGEGNSYEVTPGCTLFFPNGSTITFKIEGTDEVPEEEAYAMNFFVGLRPPM